MLFLYCFSLFLVCHLLFKLSHLAQLIHFVKNFISHFGDDIFLFHSEHYQLVCRSHFLCFHWLNASLVHSVANTRLYANSENKKKRKLPKLMCRRNYSFTVKTKQIVAITICTVRFGLRRKQKKKLSTASHQITFYFIPPLLYSSKFRFFLYFLLREIKLLC